MKIRLNSIFVEDRALAFYTKVLIQEEQGHPVGEYKWLTVVFARRARMLSCLEPNSNPAAKAYQEALFEQGIPIWLSSGRYPSGRKRLKGHGVVFTMEPTDRPGTIAIFADTCGNLIQVGQPQDEGSPGT
jgi:glyoxylase I family protein